MSMGYRYTKEQILDGALAAAFADGLSHLSFGRVAKHLGTSDRVVVYYFSSKEVLIREVLAALGVRLQSALAPAFSSSFSGRDDMLRAAWPIVATGEHDSIFALYFEASGLAASGNEPYRTLVSSLVHGWIEWTASFLKGSSAQRQREAAAAIAVLDGLLLLRQLAGAETADHAAAGLGIVSSRQRRSRDPLPPHK
jgi:AcrR family transcriptional regulator